MFVDVAFIDLTHLKGTSLLSLICQKTAKIELIIEFSEKTFNMPYSAHSKNQTCPTLAKKILMLKLNPENCMRMRLKGASTTTLFNEFPFTEYIKMY